MSRILIVDDHPVFRRGLAFLLRSEGHEIVGEAASGTEAIAAAAELAPELVLLDLGLPELHGAHVAARLRVDHPGLRIVVITMFDDDRSVQRAMDAGADAYVLKDAPPEQILAAITAVESGARVLGGGVRMSAPAEPARPAVIESAGLTGREREVAALLIHGLGNRAIGERLGVSDKTVANYVAALRLKLGAASRRDAARILREE